MILFPLGSPIFASLGSAGISMFYVSCIISQLTFSAGSIFKGGVGSELVSVGGQIISELDHRLHSVDRSRTLLPQHGGYYH
jgi:hypothetical protein